MNAPKIFITDALFQVFPRKQGADNPRQRAIEFEEDLFNHAGKRLDWQTLTEGTRYSYTELGTVLLDELRDKKLIDPLGLLALAYWTPEYNPEYSAFGPHFIHTYMPAGRVVDVCDRGSVAAYAALKIALAQLQTGGSPGQRTPGAILLGFEQTTIAREIHDHLPIPIQASAGAIVLSDRPSERSGRLLDAGIVAESGAHEGQCRIADFALEQCAKHGLDPQQLTVLMTFDGFPAKNYRYWTGARPGRSGSQFTLRSVPSDVTSMRLFTHVYASLRSDLTRERPFVLLLDSDVETLAMGWALFEGPLVWREHY